VNVEKEDKPLHWLLEEFTNGRIVILDVREPKEWAAGHIRGAIHCPIKQVEAGQLPPELPQNKPIYCHCAAGVRAKRAANALRSRYPDVHSVSYNVEQFRSAGFPIELF
jgi:rhodanese-related sulfurtransferase